MCIFERCQSSLVAATPFSNLNGEAIEVWEWITNFNLHYWACDYFQYMPFAASVTYWKDINHIQNRFEN